MNPTDRPVYSKALELLAADGPFADSADQVMLFGQFVGSWEVQLIDLQADGTRSEAQREWHFAWILGGRGVQDVLFARGAPTHQYGTTLRCYDAALDAWHVTWMAPGGGQFATLIGRQSGERIVLEGTGEDPGLVARWTFSDITPTTFTWRGEVSFDQGKTWALEQEMHAKRHRDD